jgi:hypothetical protein
MKDEENQTLKTFPAAENLANIHRSSGASVAINPLEPLSCLTDVKTCHCFLIGDGDLFNSEALKLP